VSKFQQVTEIIVFLLQNLCLSIRQSPFYAIRIKKYEIQFSFFNFVFVYLYRNRIIMVEVTVEYKDDLHCLATHGPSGQTFMTDAPVDNMGKGEFFSPTDLVATAVGACISTVMGMVADRFNLDLTGMKVVVNKEMATTPPRKIVRLMIDIEFPCPLEEKEFIALKNVVKACPVVNSLDPNIKIDTKFTFKK
jgi:putative redox protein